MYEFFQVVDETHDDPTLFPVLSAPQQSLPFELEPADGDQRQVFDCRNITVLQQTAAGWSPLKTYQDLRFGVVITQARVVVYCEKWVKGGGWRGFGVGGLAFAVAANAVSHARAAHRRKGRLLAAQVRYPWLVHCAALTDKRGRPVAVRLVVNAGSREEQRVLALDIPVRHTDPGAVAAAIATAAAQYRLAAGPPVAEIERPAWARLAARTPADGTGNGNWSLPSAIRVGAAGSIPVAPAPPEQDGTLRPLPAARPASPDTMPFPQPASAAGSPSPSPQPCPGCGQLTAVTAAACPRCGRERVPQAGYPVASPPRGGQ